MAHLGGRAPLGFFDTVVAQTVEFLRNAWPDELEKLTWQVSDAPPGITNHSEVARFAVNRERFRITIFRIPIERLTHHRRTDKLDERFHIEQYVFQAVAELLGKEPNELLP